jgi:hypothetical protein
VPRIASLAAKTLAALLFESHDLTGNADSIRSVDHGRLEFRPILEIRERAHARGA